MSDGPVFSVRVLAALIVTGVVVFAGLLVISIFGTDIQRESDYRANSYSVSAVGHKALVEALKASGRTVLVSRGGSARKAGERNLLMLLEPGGADLVKSVLGDQRATHTSLIVLPKWSFFRHAGNHRWVDEVRPAYIDITADIVEPLAKDIVVNWTNPARLVDGDFIKAAPKVTVDKLQLIKPNKGLTPLLTVGGNTLLARVGTRFSRTYLLSDPDILNNQGLGRGQNAELVAKIIDRLAGEGGAIIVDEEIHGFGQDPDLWKNLFSPPLLAPTLAVSLALLALVLSGVRRFGPAMKARPEHAAGRGTLYDVTAMLLGQRGDYRLLAREYAAMTMRVMAEEMRLSRRLTSEERVRHIAEIGRRRGVEGDLRGMLAGLGYFGAAGAGRRAEAVAIAARLNQWSKEVLHGIR